jgi:hypothetical protein
MVLKMKNYKLAISMSLNIMIIVSLLFLYVPQGNAQEDQDWTQPVNLSLSGLATNPLLVIDFRGTLHTLWVDEVDGYKYSQSADDGMTWSVSQTVKFPFGKKDSPPVLLADANGSIHIFWISSDADLSYSQTTPQDFANPSKWQATKRLAGDVLIYDVIVDSQGALHIAYIHNASSDASPAGVYYKQSIVGGGSWTDAVGLYESEYFRSTEADASFIRVATSNSTPDQRVYVAWDSRPQKRVFMAISENAGLNWSQAKEIKGPEDTGSIDTPFNLNVATVENKILLLWQMGQPGSAKCSVFSQWSENNGENWGDIVSVLSGPTDCPVSSKFIVQTEDHIVALLTGQGDPTLVAWNGEQWSDPQTQTQLPTFSNPLTYDAILLGCRFDVIYQNRLYVVGCDQGGGGDVWFLSRALQPVENWFSLPNTWGAPVIIGGKAETISYLASASDTKGVLHTIRVQSSLSDEGRQIVSLEYARWTGKQWTRPEPVISPLGGVPLQISFAIDTQERLLLSWVDGDSGDLLFSWANLDRANLASEWETPMALPSPSSLVGSPDIVVDASGRIVVVYAIILNEDRGIYIVQSTDSGESWSSPVRVFDAVSARWDKIGDPKISLSEDGVLHVVFSRNSVRTGQPVGLYYSRSVDGGVTWSDSQILSEGDIQWSDIVSYDDHIVHVLWQEYDGLVFANLSQVSQDGGVSWGRPFSITGVNDSSTPVTLVADGLGKLHFIQLLKNSNPTTTKGDNLILQDWKWNSSGWEFASDETVMIKGEGTRYSVTAGITSDGFLVVSISTEYSDPENEPQNEIQTFSRFLGESNTGNEPRAALIPTPFTLSGTAGVPNILPTQPVDLTVLNDDEVSTTSTVRDVVGLVIIGVAVIITALYLMRSRSGHAKK